MTDPVVSYVITVYNKKLYLEDLVRSILKQSIRPIQIVFVDDGSQDGSDEQLLAIANDISADDVSVQCVLEDQNWGPSTAINHGIREATGNWIHFVDADDVLVPEASALFLNAARMYGSDLLYGGKVKLEASASCEQFVDPRCYRFDDALYGLIRSRLVGMRFFCTRELATVEADERIFTQDVSLPYRIAHRAKSLTVLNAPVVMIRNVEGSLSKNKSQEHADFLGAAALFLDEFDVTRKIRARIVRRCLRRMRKFQTTSEYLPWEILSIIGAAPPTSVHKILKHYVGLHDLMSLRKGRAFVEIEQLLT